MAFEGAEGQGRAVSLPWAAEPWVPSCSLAVVCGSRERGVLSRIRGASRLPGPFLVERDGMGGVGGVVTV